MSAMNCRFLLAAALLLAFLASAAFSETPDKGLFPEKSLAAQRSWVQFGVRVGRLQVLNSQVGQSLSASSEDPHEGIRESFSVNVGSTVVSVHYELVTPDVRLLADFSEPNCVEIESTPCSDRGGAALRLKQPARGPIELTVGRGSDARHCRASSFWHLMLREPELCEIHLVPILTSLRPGWQLDRATAEVEMNLLRLARDGHLPHSDQWEELVEQLGHKTFRVRRAAERELRASGQAVVAYLSQLDPRQLDTEQRERIRRIVRSQVAQTEDTPQRVALWLAADEAVWLAMMSRQDPNTRSVATMHLARLTGKPVDQIGRMVEGVRTARQTDASESGNRR
jgi:hypothetical protein